MTCLKNIYLTKTHILNLYLFTCTEMRANATQCCDYM